MKRHGWFIVLIAGLVTVNFLRYLDLPLYADDYRWLRWTIELLRDPASLFTLEAAMFRIVVKLLYVPLWLLFGTNPVGYHLVDLGLLWAIVALAFLVYHRLGLGLAAVVMATLVHALHPYHLGAFLICGSTTGLLGWLLYLLAFLLFLQYRQEKNLRAYRWSWLVFAVGLFVNEGLVTLPLLFLAYDLTLVRREHLLPHLGTLARRHFPFFLLLLVFLGAEWSVQRGTYMMAEGNYALSWAQGNYGKSMLGLIHPFWREGNVKYLDLLPHFGAILAVIWGGHRLRFFALWIYVAYLPYALLSWGHESRYLLIPSFGLGGLVGILVEKVWGDRTRKLVIATGIAFFVISHIGVNYSRLPEWFVTEANKTRRFIATLRSLPAVPVTIDLIDEPHEELKFIIPDFICPVEFPHGVNCSKVSRAEHDPRRSSVTYDRGEFTLHPPAP